MSIGYQILRRIFDFKICSAIFALNLVTLELELLRNFSLFTIISHDIAPFRKVWSVWKLELLLLF